MTLCASEGARLSEEPIIDIDQQLNTCTLADLQTEAAAVASLRRLSGTGLLLGRVRTARCEPNDILGALEALDRAQADEILVLGSIGTATRHCFVGDNMALAAVVRGVQGIIVDGYVRDLRGIRELGLSIHARGTEMIGATASGEYELDGLVTIDGIGFRSGDYVAVDDDGIARIPADRCDDLLREAARQQEREEGVRTAIRAGRTIREAHQSVGFVYGTER